METAQIRNKVWGIASYLSHYGIDSFCTIINKLSKLINEEGYSLSEAEALLKRCYNGEFDDGY